MATAKSRSWLIETAIRAMPSCSARRSGAIVEPHRRLPRWQALDLDLAPADPAHAQAQDLADGLLGGPAPGEGLGPVAHVGGLGRGEDAASEPLAETLERRADAGDADDVDAQLGRPGGAARRLGDRAGAVADAHYSTVTDLARLRGWSTSVPRATATW